MKHFLQYLLIAWFLIVSVLVLVPSVTMLWCGCEMTPIKAPPEPPAPPEELSDHSLEWYTQQVAAYQKHLDAYKTYMAGLGQTPRQQAYDAVVTKTLLPLLDKFIVALLGFVFVVSTTVIVDNELRMRRNFPPRSLPWS